MIGCPGSVRLAATLPREYVTNRYQAEGTAAHLVVQQALTGERQPDEWLGRVIKVDGFEFEVDEEMTNSAGLYLDTVMEHMTAGVEQFVEYKLSLASLDPSDPLIAENRGTGDCVVVNRKAGKLNIIDLKYGKGVAVDGDSPQLKNYAVMGALEFFPDGGCREVVTTVVQPRLLSEASQVKRVVHDPVELLGGFVGQLVGAMEDSLLPEGPLNPGKWCRWCPAKLVCPALRDAALHMAEDGFDNPVRQFFSGDALGPLPDEVWVGTAEQPRPMTIVPRSQRVVFPPVTDLDPGELSTLWLSRFPLYDAFKAAVGHRMVQLMESGTKIPGMDLDRRSAHRAWKDKDAVPTQLRVLGVPDDQMFTEPKLRSPAQIEKLLPKDKKHFMLADDQNSLVTRPLGEIVLVPASRVERKSVVGPAFGPLPETDEN